MRLGAPERLGIDRLAGCTLYQVRSTEPHERCSLHHHDQIGQRGEICPAGDTRAHHRGELRYTQVPPHDRVVVKQPSRAILTGEDAALIGQIHARGVDEIDDRNTAAHRDFLCAQHLLDRLGPPRARLHRRVVGDYDYAPAFDDCDPSDDARARRLSFVLVVSDEEPDLEEEGPAIAETSDALASGQLTLLVLLIDALGTTALTQLCLEPSHSCDELTQSRMSAVGLPRARRSRSLACRARHAS